MCLFVVLAGCAGPARTDGSYNSKAVATAEQTRSSVETALVALDALRRHSLPSAYVSVTVAESETDAASALSGFESVQPPSTRSDAVRDDTTEVVGDAVDLLADARIAVRRGASGPVDALIPELREASSRLDELTRSLEG
jgi:hypothetical protein